MPDLPTLSNPTSFSTKDILLMLGRPVLGKNIPVANQGDIPITYIAMFAKLDCLYAKAREIAKYPDVLIKLIATASALKNNISQSAKAKTEYKLYLEQIDASLKKADEQLDKQKDFAKILDSTLIEWHTSHQENALKLTRPGVNVNSPTMIAPIKKAIELGNNLIRQSNEINHQRDLMEKNLKEIIETIKMVVPAAEIAKAEAAVVKTPSVDSLDDESYFPFRDEKP